MKLDNSAPTKGGGKRMPFNYTKNTVRRSRLIMPANVAKFVEKAYLRNADCIVLDLEDSVPQAEKTATRQLIKKLIPVAGKGGSEVFVRVNNNEEYLKDDIEASVWPGLDGLYIPKVESGTEIRAIEKLVEKLEQERGIPAGQIKLSVIIESCKGYLNINEIASASERVDSLTLGIEDFLRDAGMVENGETQYGLMAPRLQINIVARAHNKIPMGLIGSLANYGDANAFEKSAELAYQYGFLGASCINPANVETLNRAFTPKAAEVEQAKNIIAVFEEAMAQGRGSTKLEGKMIDYVHYERAQALVERASIIEAFEQKKQTAREEITKEGAVK